MSVTTLLVHVGSNCEAGEKNQRKFWFMVTEAPSELFVGDTIEFSNGVFVTVTSRSWRRKNKDSYLVIECVTDAIPFNKFFESGEKITENEAHLENIAW